MIADTIKQLREQHNMTQTQLANRLSITRSSVNAWEMGISCPSTQYLVELAHLFSVSTDYLLGLNDRQMVSIEGLDEEELGILYGLLGYFKDNTK
ncbi:MAG: helix-turn-helix transcriptional regulator [Eubacteriales bacterium]